MHAAVRIVALVGLVAVMAACSGSDGSVGKQALTDAACEDPGCGREDLAPAPLACGGLTAATCPQGYRCVDDPADSCDPTLGAADCGGICVLGEELPACGGLAGTPCPTGSVCADDPTDACEGGPAGDCPGICRPEAQGECTSDADCPTLDVACSVCADGTVSCARSHCDGGRCSVDFKACPEPLVCGGISGQSCEPGLRCVDDPTDECDPDMHADCRGICVPDDTSLRCNGIAGVTCPPGFDCVDDPNDTCEPQDGGADCPGICEPAEIGECKTDADCPTLRAPCSVCPDNTEVCPRSLCDHGRCIVNVPTCTPPVVCDGCKPGDVCVDDPDESCDPATGSSCQGMCVPPNRPRPCGGLIGDTCPAGYGCVDDPNDDCSPDSSGADCPGVCEPARPPQCTADEDCVHILGGCTPCPDGTFACPHSECRDGMCALLIDACVTPGFCGGIAGFPCPPGSTCVDDPRDDCDPTTGGADCGGMCVREEEPRRCAGFTGEPCPEGYECVDDARDDCDPDGGGADCPGICQPAPGAACNSDADCLQIGAPCQICASGIAACPRSFCEAGTCRAEFGTCMRES